MTDDQKAASDLLAACSKLKRALAQVQCAILDLHEAFVHRDRQQLEELHYRTQAVISRAQRR